MSHFNRWWSKQRIEDKEAKRFSHTVWNEAAKPYQATIDKLTAELAEASTIANNNYEVILKCNRQINDLKRELARYRNGVEVEV